jgi:2-phosphosulfolactate phosphatase
VKLSAFFTPAELWNAEPADVVVVVDVLRATSTIVQALANGARAIFPVATVEDAAALAQNLGRDTTLLCGERGGLPIDGFDLGNSPAEFTRERVEGQALVMTTTNGTRALLAAAEQAGGDGTSVLVGSFLNLEVVARRLRRASAAWLVCAGREGRYATEDALCVGALVRALESTDNELELNDAADTARRLIGKTRDVARLLGLSTAGRHLVELGLGDDVTFCARLNRSTHVPEFRERKITVE